MSGCSGLRQVCSVGLRHGTGIYMHEQAFCNGGGGGDVEGVPPPLLVGRFLHLGLKLRADEVRFSMVKACGVSTVHVGLRCALALCCCHIFMLLALEEDTASSVQDARLKIGLHVLHI